MVQCKAGELDGGLGVDFEEFDEKRLGSCRRPCGGIVLHEEVHAKELERVGDGLKGSMSDYGVRRCAED